MPAISPEDAALLRAPWQALDGVTLCVHPLQIIATCKVAAAPDYDNRVSELAIDTLSSGFYGATRRGQRFEIRDPATGALKFSGALRLNPEDGVLPIPGHRAGDTGFAAMTGQQIADDDDVIIYDAPMVAANLSFLNPSNGVLYKRDDYEFDPDYPQSEYFDPHADIGPHRLARVAAGEHAELSFTDVSVDYSEHGTLEREFIPPSSWTQTGGADEYDSPVTYDIPPGNHILIMRSARTGGTKNNDSSFAFRHVFVVDGPGGVNPAFSDRFALTQAELRGDRTGWEARFTVKINAADEAELKAFLYPGAFCLFREHVRVSSDGWQTWDTTDGIDGVVDTFCGHLRRYEQISVDAEGVQTWTLLFQSWTLFCGSLPVPSQVFRAKTSPASWYQVHPDNMTIARILFMLLFWHTELARLYSIKLSDLDAYKRPRLSFHATSLLAAMQNIAGNVWGANVGCAADGAFFARRHLSFMTNTERNALDIVWTWEAGDWTAALTQAVEPLMRVGKLLGGGRVSGTTEPEVLFKAQAGYLAQSMGLDTEARINNLIGLSESDIYRIIGDAYQNMNRPIEAIPGAARGVVSVIDPARMEPHSLALDDYAPLEREAYSETKRVLPLGVTRTYEVTRTGIIKRETFTMEPETKGKPAPPWTDPVPAQAIKPGPAPDPVPPCDIAHGADHHYCWNFLTSDGGWTPIVGTPSRAVWNSGTGWEANEFYASLFSTVVCEIVKSAPATTGRTIVRTEVDVAYVRGAEGAQNFDASGGILQTTNFSGTLVGRTTGAMPATLAAGAVVSSRFGDFAEPRGSLVITAFRVWYNGAQINFTGGYGS